MKSSRAVAALLCGIVVGLPMAVAAQEREGESRERPRRVSGAKRRSAGRGTQMIANATGNASGKSCAKAKIATDHGTIRTKV